MCVKNFTFREIFKKIETAVRCLIQNWVYNINQLNFIGKFDERKIAIIHVNELNLIECVISQLLCDCRHFLHAIEAEKNCFWKSSSPWLAAYWKIPRLNPNHWIVYVGYDTYVKIEKISPQCIQERFYLFMNFIDWSLYPFDRWEKLMEHKIDFHSTLLRLYTIHTVLLYCVELAHRDFNQSSFGNKRVSVWTHFCYIIEIYRPNGLNWLHYRSQVRNCSYSNATYWINLYD